MFHDHFIVCCNATKRFQLETLCRHGLGWPVTHSGGNRAELCAVSEERVESEYMHTYTHSSLKNYTITIVMYTVAQKKTKYSHSALDKPSKEKAKQNKIKREAHPLPPPPPYMLGFLFSL